MQAKNLNKFFISFKRKLELLVKKFDGSKIQVNRREFGIDWYLSCASKFSDNDGEEYLEIFLEPEYDYRNG